MLGLFSLNGFVYFVGCVWWLVMVLVGCYCYWVIVCFITAVGCCFWLVLVSFVFGFAFVGWLFWAFVLCFFGVILGLGLGLVVVSCGV